MPGIPPKPPMPKGDWEISGGAVPGAGAAVELAACAVGAGAGLAGAGLGLAAAEPDCLITRCTVMPVDKIPR